jgi:hypothetical protein
MLLTPPLLLGATLIFWGQQTGRIGIGIAIGLVIEASRWSRRRWEISQEEFNQLWNITMLLFAGGAAYVFAVNDGLATIGGVLGAGSFSDRSRALDQASQTVVVFLRWLPAIFFPFTAAQAFSTRGRIPLSTFSWYLRRRNRGRPDSSAAPNGGVNTAFPLFSICLISTSTINEPGPGFYAGLSGLVAWALWSFRSPRTPRAVWVLLMALAIGAGLLVANGLRAMQRVVEDLQVRALNNIGGGGRDSRSAQTAIGQLGRLKGSARIVLRVQFLPESRVTHRLREACYNFYRWPEWRAAGAGRDFASMSPASTESSWRFTDAPSQDPLQISAYLDGGQGVLALPHGVTVVDQLGVADLKTNAIGTARVESGPGLVDYIVRRHVSATFDGPPEGDADLNIPAAELPALDTVAAELRLADLPEPQRISAIEHYFARHFSYSLYQDAGVLETNRELRSPLARFLLQSRTGHCEYFATATTLLLRRAGIPARYAVGYVVDEHVGRGRYVVRGRHAHAWCVYFDRGTQAWKEIDTTPGTWLAMEAERRSLLEPIQDAFSWAWFQFSRLRWGLGGVRIYLFYAAMAALVLAVGQFLWSRRGRPKGLSGPGAKQAQATPGSDSEFYAVERRLAALGWSRLPSETLHAWRRRIGQQHRLDEATLEGIIELHYQLRFDPGGIPVAARERLRALASAVLEATKS